LGLQSQSQLSKNNKDRLVKVIDDVKCFDGFRSLIDAKRLRSFLSIKEIGRTCIAIILGSSRFQYMMCSPSLSFYVLYLSILFDLVEVPDSIGNLKHLQSLNFLKTRIQKLPESTCLFYNLLILKLNFCGYLKPSNLHKLTKVRCLEFKITKVTKLPMDLGELKNLRVPSTIFVH